jgi:hypothetical protein
MAAKATRRNFRDFLLSAVAVNWAYTKEHEAAAAMPRSVLGGHLSILHPEPLADGRPDRSR